MRKKRGAGKTGVELKVLKRVTHVDPGWFRAAVDPWFLRATGRGPGGRWGYRHKGIWVPDEPTRQIRERQRCEGACAGQEETLRL